MYVSTSIILEEIFTFTLELGRATWKGMYSYISEYQSIHSYFIIYISITNQHNRVPMEASSKVSSISSLIPLITYSIIIKIKAE